MSQQQIVVVRHDQRAAQLPGFDIPLVPGALIKTPVEQLASWQKVWISHRGLIRLVKLSPKHAAPAPLGKRWRIARAHCAVRRDVLLLRSIIVFSVTNL